MKVIDDEMLQRFARALNVPFRLSQDFGGGCTDGGVSGENNTVNDSEQNTGGAKINIGTVKLIPKILTVVMIIG